MKLKVKVMQTSTDTRSIVDTKTGAARVLRISNVLGSLDNGDILNCRTFDEKFVCPEVGKQLEFDMRRYEKKGMIADVIF